jgi:hypothetical protein
MCLDAHWSGYCNRPAFQNIPCCNSGDTCHTSGTQSRCCAGAGVTMDYGDAQSRCCNGATPFGHNMATCN